MNAVALLMQDGKSQGKIVSTAFFSRQSKQLCKYVNVSTHSHSTSKIKFMQINARKM